jgi:deoxyribose-phosphate aldolase
VHFITDKSSDMKSPASSIDHTLLKADATVAQIERLCLEAIHWQFASVCIPPRFVAEAAGFLRGSGVVVGTVIGFPLGYDTAAVKCAATAQAVAEGAGEIDMVIPLGAALDGRLDEVLDDVERVLVSAAGKPVKVIIECCYLSNALKVELVDLLAKAGAAYVKTSTGFAMAGATREDVRLLYQASGGRIKVKAAGGIRDWAVCQAMLKAGAHRIGTSNGIRIMQQWQEEQGI